MNLIGIVLLVTGGAVSWLPLSLVRETPMFLKISFSDFWLLPPCSFASNPWTRCLRAAPSYNGDGSAGVVTDVGISGDRIVAVGDLSGRKRNPDAGRFRPRGHPGFHRYPQPRGPRYRREKRHFPVAGCGKLYPPGCDNGDRRTRRQFLVPVSRSCCPCWKNHPSAVNFGTFVGHNTVRELAMGRADRAPTAEELQAMKGMVRHRNERRGLRPVVGLEIHSGRLLRKQKKSSNWREWPVRTAVSTSPICVKRASAWSTASAKPSGLVRKVACQPRSRTTRRWASSTWGKSAETLAMIDAANAAWLDISSDQYPYAASSTGIDVLFPAWSLAGDEGRPGWPGCRIRIRAPRSRAASSTTSSTTGEATIPRAWPSRTANGTRLNGKNLARSPAARGPGSHHG